MTLKYESEILFDLMKRDGEDAPSDVLPYESELKEKYLQQVEGAYPKLMDYRPEWLNYNLVAHLPADFPVETLSNVTEATVDNVVPYAYGSASLKGQTLVNLFDRNSMTLEGLTYTFDNGVYTITTTKEWCKLKFTPNLVQNKKYFIMFSTSINDVCIFYRNSSDEATKICSSEQCPFIFTNPIDNIKNVTIEFPTKVINGTVSYPIFVEYQDGMENWDIPYFEGMQSVEMPGLTTIGKNLIFVGRGYNNTITTDGLTITRDAVNQTITLNGSVTRDNVSQTLENLFYHKIKKGERYALSCYLISGTADRIMFRANEKKWSDSMSCELNNPRYKTFDKDIIFNDCSFRVDKGAIFKNAVFKVMLERIPVNSNTTSYEPYQSNILTVNEPVELRGIGDVKDELNLLTGELTQRIGEVILDGNEKWERRTTEDNKDGFEDTLCFYYRTTDMTEEHGLKPQVLCDRFNYNSEGYYSTGESVSSYKDVAYGNRDIFIRIKRERLETEDLDGFKKWLKTNILTVQYPIEKVIKTVDLTVTDQDGNAESIIRPTEGTMYLMTEGDTIKPLFSGEIPVEAITQNLASFIKG